MLRREGNNGKHNLNLELANNLASRITTSWRERVARLTFKSWGDVITKAVMIPLNMIVEESPTGAKFAAEKHRDSSLRLAESTVRAAVRSVAYSAQSAQKELTRMIEPEVALHYKGTYGEANQCRGKGSVKKRRVRAPLHNLLQLQRVYSISLGYHQPIYPITWTRCIQGQRTGSQKRISIPCRESWTRYKRLSCGTTSSGELATV